MKTGIVMEGGAMRGMFTAGLLDVLMESDIRFDGAVGVSAGATFGCNLKSHQIGRTLRYNKKYCRDKRYASLESLIRTGDIFNAEFDYDEIPNRLDPYDTEAALKEPMDFWVVCTDADSGRPVYHRCDFSRKDEVQWLRASASMPLLSNIVYCSGTVLTCDRTDEECTDFNKKYTWLTTGTGPGQVNMGLSDGGTSDSVPVSFFEDLGYDRILVICTQPKGYRKKKSPLMPLIELCLRKHPMLAEALRTRPDRYNAQMELLDRAAESSSGRIMVIRPEAELGIKKIVHDPDEIQRVYDIGRRMGEKKLDSIRSFLTG